MDVVNGKVIKVIDYNTIEINVTEIGVRNEYNYMQKERIKLLAVNNVKIHIPNTPWDINNIEEMLMGKSIRCEINHRDYFSRLVSDVKIIQLDSSDYNNFN